MALPTYYGNFVGGTLTAPTATITLLTLINPLSVANGGTGSAAPSLVAGTGTTVSGSWPNQAVNVTGVTSVAVSAPLTSTGGATPTLGLTTPLAVAYGGTGSATQSFVDLTTVQNIGGAKTLTSALAGTSASFSGGIAANGMTSTGGVVVGGPLSGASSGAFSAGVTFAGGLAVANATGQMACSSDGVHGGYVAPVYNASGAPLANTTHAVFFQFQAVGASTVVTFTSASVFVSSATYIFFVFDVSVDALITTGFSSITGNGFTVTTVNTHFYNVFAIGS